MEKINKIEESIFSNCNIINSSVYTYINDSFSNVDIGINLSNTVFTICVKQIDFTKYANRLLLELIDVVGVENTNTIKENIIKAFIESCVMYDTSDSMGMGEVIYENGDEIILENISDNYYMYLSNNNLSNDSNLSNEIGNVLYNSLTYYNDYIKYNDIFLNNENKDNVFLIPFRWNINTESYLLSIVLLGTIDK